MTQEELINFLKENLAVYITTSTEFDYGKKIISLEVSLSLGDETISKSSETISIE